MEKERKARGSQRLKDCYSIFRKFNETEKAMFFGKFFAVELRGLNADFKKSVKAQWKTMTNTIAAEQKKQATIDGLDAIDLPILEEAVARRKKAIPEKK